MAAANAPFRAALGRIHLSAEVQTAIISQGINSIMSLTLIGDDGIKSICKIIRDDEIVIPFMQQQYLVAMRFWGRDRLRLGLPIDPVHFTLAEAQQAALLMIQEEQELAVRDTVKPVPPDKFTRATNWLVFREALVAYLSQLKGINRIPLNYVIRDDEHPNPDAVYDNERERRIATVPLHGHDFRQDCESVFAIIKELTLQGPGWTWIESLDRGRNGRICFQALVAHYEGAYMINRAKEQAYADIAGAKYTGSNRNYTFETYTSTHQQAHNVLRRNGEPVPPGKQVRDYLAGITFDNTDVAAAIAFCRADPTYLNNFDATAGYLATILESSSIRAASARRIGAIVQSNPTGRGNGSVRGRGGRGGLGSYRGRYGRGRGRGGRFGRGGRSGRGMVDRTYTSEEWAALSPETQEAVREIRRIKRSHSQISVTESKHSHVSSPPAPSTITTIPPGVPQPPDVHAGDQFGRHGHNQIS